MRKNNYEVKAYNDFQEEIRALIISAESEDDAASRFSDEFAYLRWAYLEVEEL